MIVTNQLISINFQAFTGALPTTWNLTPTYPNGALDVSQIEARTFLTTWSGWGAVTAFDNDTNIATFTAPVGSTQVEFRRTTPRYSVYLDPKATTSRVSQRNLQVNADQGLYTAIEWAAQFGIDAQAVLLPAPGQVPNTLGLQQQTQNYWVAADYTSHVWNFNFAGGYIDRSHVKAQVLLSTGWTQLTIDTYPGGVEFNYELREDGTLELEENGLIEAREGVIDPNDTNTSPFRFIGPYALYMDFSVLHEVPKALIIYRHTPRNVMVSSPLDATRITADGMDPSARHALFVAVEIGEQLAQYAPTCECFLDAIDTLSWSFPNGSVHLSEQSVTLTGNATALYNLEMTFTADMESRKYTDNIHRLSTDGRIISADSNLAPNTGNWSWSVANYYGVQISDPPQLFFINAALDTESVGVNVHMSGGPESVLRCQVRGNATIRFYASDVDNVSGYYPQYGTVTSKVAN